MESANAFNKFLQVREDAVPEKECGVPERGGASAGGLCRVGKSSAHVQELEDMPDAESEDSLPETCANTFRPHVHQH